MTASREHHDVGRVDVFPRFLTRRIVTSPFERSRGSAAVTVNVSPGLQPTHAANSTHARATSP
jgi:hypothetical protein